MLLNSALGIVSALVCYSPIFDMVTSRYLGTIDIDYHNQLPS